MILLMQSQSEGMFQPLENALSTFLSYIPQLIGALIILIVGYICLLYTSDAADE